MAVNPDFKDLFKTLNAARVEFLVVGAHAVFFHARPRYTKDLDVWVNPTPANAERVWKALQRFGAPLQNLAPANFTDNDLVYQIGVEPNRIDVLTSLSGLSFADAWQNRKRTTYGNIPVSTLGREHLVAVKRIAGRPQDLLDVFEVERAQKVEKQKKISQRQKSPRR